VPDHLSKRASLGRVLLAYVLAVGAGAAWLYLGPDTAYLWLDGLIADIVATLVIFVFSRIHHNSSFYDAYWSVLPPLLALYWWSESSPNDLRALLVMIVIMAWAIRLTANWAHLFPGLHHEDWRYARLREGRSGATELLIDLFAIHLIPTLQVFLGMVPVYVAVTVAGRDVGWLDWLALAVGLGAVLLELAADRQMQRFARDRQPGQVMDRGLWGWSRHPNYLGEITFWLSLALFGLAASPSDWWFVFVGAVAMVLLFLFASIPMMEQRSLQRRPTYQDVIDRVPMLFPRPPRRAS
jgi:steroid 5-alpha reductase family enzyme